jgi:hypothetical protein
VPENQVVDTRRFRGLEEGLVPLSNVVVSAPGLPVHAAVLSLEATPQLPSAKKN